MPRKGSKAKPQKSKNKRRDYSYTDISKEMSDKEFEKGSKDGGYNNFIPYTGDNAFDKSEIVKISDMKELIPKQKRDENKYR